MTGLFGHDDTCRVRFFCLPECGAVTQTVVLRYGSVLADGQDTCGSYHSSFADDECAIVKGGVFKEDVLYESCGHLCVESFAGIDDLFEGFFNELFLNLMLTYELKYLLYILIFLSFLYYHFPLQLKVDNLIFHFFYLYM